MNKYPIRLREKVNSLIGEMEKYAYLFSKNGEKDFTRKRKIPFSQVIKSLISAADRKKFLYFFIVRLTGRSSPYSPERKSV